MNAKSSRKRTCALLGMLLLFTGAGVWVWFRAQPNLTEVDGTRQGGDPHGKATAIGRGTDSSARIIADTLTPTGRVVTVTKNGEQRRVVLSPSMEFSTDELAKIAFPSDQPEPERVPLRTLLNQHLYFYGIAVDEETNAVAGAKAVGKVTYMDGKVSRIDTVQGTAGPDGRFSFESAWGQMVMVSVSKAPDYIEPPVQIFQYGPVGSQPKHQPDIAAPVVFVLHRKKAMEPLFKFARWFGAPNSGQPVRVDLTTGQIVAEGGDLIVSIYCPEAYTNLKPFPWKLSVQAIDGGIVGVASDPANEVRLEYMHEAPANGYAPGFAVEYGPQTSEFNRQHGGMYYVKSRNGQVYAKMAFRMNTSWDERGVPFRIEAVVNTNGSLNLQTPILK